MADSSDLQRKLGIQAVNALCRLTQQYSPHNASSWYIETCASGVQYYMAFGCWWELDALGNIVLVPHLVFSSDHKQMVWYIVHYEYSFLKVHMWNTFWGFFIWLDRDGPHWWLKSHPSVFPCLGISEGNWGAVSSQCFQLNSEADCMLCEFRTCHGTWPGVFGPSTRGQKGNMFIG